jgi:hypothetical protein
MRNPFFAVKAEPRRISDNAVGKLSRVRKCLVRKRKAVRLRDIPSLRLPCEAKRGDNILRMHAWK